MEVLTDLLSALLHRVHAFLTTILLHVISLGPIPQHVGFVMDGNRRYARGKGKVVAQGHADGFQSLRRTLEICLRLRIRAVSIYAFSIENFSRDEKEVEALFSLAKTRLLELCEHGDLLQGYGIRLRFVGARKMLPADLASTVSRMEEMTARNTKGLLNVCSPYTSRDEITTAVRETMSEMKDEAHESTSLITAQRIFSNLGTSQGLEEVFLDDTQSLADHLEGGKLDILVRTSNVKRLSDFMMWQASKDAQLHFVKTNWPEFGLTDILPILLGWQQKIWLQRLARLSS